MASVDEHAMANEVPLPRGVYRSQVGWRGGYLVWRGGRWQPPGWRPRRARAHDHCPIRLEPLPGAEGAPRCDCGRRAVYRGSWRCEACGRARMTAYRWLETPRGVEAWAAKAAPLIFRPKEETNCDTGRAEATQAGETNVEWLGEVEWLTSWGRNARAQRFRLAGVVPGAESEATVRGWHEDRARGVGERFDRVRQCGADTGLEWVERADEHGEVVPSELARRFPHRTACGQWRVCKRCLRMRRDKLRAGVMAQRALAIAMHRSKLDRRYAGREGRWTERLITFTVRHRDLAEDTAVLARAWRKVEAPLRRHLRKRGQQENTVWVRSIEVSGTEHAHLHIWQLGPYLEYSLVRAWWGAALESEGYDVPRRPLKEVLARANDSRTEEWLAPYVDADNTVPWPVMDIRGSEGGHAAKYVAKVSAAVALYTAKQGEYVDLAPVHAARVYEALEGRRVTQWARGWAPPRERSYRWMLRRISQVAPGDASRRENADRPGLDSSAGVRNSGQNRSADTLLPFGGHAPPE